ncbi:hypothetical protein Lal_00013079 [Lupinus albus]|nr:hypothetical protein Lal_00013079 [Lupinus albus]
MSEQICTGGQTHIHTKAMGEMLVVHHKDNMPLIIIRPTMITSTYKDPFPGWIEDILKPRDNDGNRFDDTNTEKLRMETKVDSNMEVGVLDFDPTSIDWTEYMMNVHIPGLVKYAMK